MVLSCAAEYTALPQRLAGTASQYSKNAMPQLAMMTSGSGCSLNFRWPYQAKVMKTLEANSIRKGRIVGEIVGIDTHFQMSRVQMSRANPRVGKAVPSVSISFDFKNAKLCPAPATPS